MKTKMRVRKKKHSKERTRLKGTTASKMRYISFPIGLGEKKEEKRKSERIKIPWRGGEKGGRGQRG